MYFVKSCTLLATFFIISVLGHESLLTTTRNDDSCMEVSTKFFTNNLPPASEDIFEYFADGLPPCPLDRPGEKCNSNKCALPGKRDNMCCENNVCPCLKVQNGGTCPKPDLPLIFNQQMFILNESCHGVYTTWSIFKGTGEQTEFSITPVIDKTAGLIPVLNKYIYLTGFGAKNIDGYYVTYYAHFRICLGNLLKLLNLDASKLLSTNLVAPSLLDLGSGNCACELKKPFSSVSIYMAKPAQFNMVEGTTLFKFITENSDKSHKFSPSSAAAGEVKCPSSGSCKDASIFCKDQALVKCCVSGLCNCVSNPDKKTCLPCSSNGVYVADLLQCNNLEGIEYTEFVSLYKRNNVCGGSETPFSATLIPNDAQDPFKGPTIVVGNMVKMTNTYVFSWYGKLVITPRIVQKIVDLIKSLII